MKKLFLLSILFIFNYSVFGQSSTSSDTIFKKNTGLHFVAKLGFGRIWESGKGPLNGFIGGVDAIYSIKLKTTYLQTGLGYLAIDANRTENGNTAAITNEYLQIPLIWKSYKTIFDDQSKKQRLQSVTGVGLYANTLLNQKKEAITGNSSAIYLGWNYGYTFQLGLKYAVSDKWDIETGWQFQGDLSKMKKNGIERKTDYINAFYFDFKF